MALTRWKITQPGICYLESFSEGFKSLIAHEPDFLFSCFTCVQMYTPREYSSTIKFLELLGSCRVDSLSVRVPILRGTGEIIPVVSMISVEFENGIPRYASICMNRFDAKDNIPYWEPFDVKLRSMANLWYQNQQPSPPKQRTSPTPLDSNFIQPNSTDNSFYDNNQQPNITGNTYQENIFLEQKYATRPVAKNFASERNYALLDFSQNM